MATKELLVKTLMTASGLLPTANLHMLKAVFAIEDDKPVQIPLPFAHDLPFCLVVHDWLNLIIPRQADRHPRPDRNGRYCSIGGGGQIFSVTG